MMELIDHDGDFSSASLKELLAAREGKWKVVAAIDYDSCPWQYLLDDFFQSRFVEERDATISRRKVLMTTRRKYESDCVLLQAMRMDSAHSPEDAILIRKVAIYLMYIADVIILSTNAADLNRNYSSFGDFLRHMHVGWEILNKKFGRRQYPQWIINNHEVQATRDEHFNKLTEILDHDLANTAGAELMKSSAAVYESSADKNWTWRVKYASDMGHKISEALAKAQSREKEALVDLMTLSWTFLHADASFQFPSSAGTESTSRVQESRILAFDSAIEQINESVNCIEDASKAEAILTSALEQFLEDTKTEEKLSLRYREACKLSDEIFKHLRTRYESCLLEAMKSEIGQLFVKSGIRNVAFAPDYPEEDVEESPILLIENLRQFWKDLFMFFDISCAIVSLNKTIALDSTSLLLHVKSNFNFEDERVITQRLAKLQLLPYIDRAAQRLIRWIEDRLAYIWVQSLPHFSQDDQPEVDVFEAEVLVDESFEYPLKFAVNLCNSVKLILSTCDTDLIDAILKRIDVDETLKADFDTRAKVSWIVLYYFTAAIKDIDAQLQRATHRFAELNNYVNKDYDALDQVLDEGYAILDARSVSQVCITPKQWTTLPTSLSSKLNAPLWTKEQYRSFKERFVNRIPTSALK